MSQIKLTAKMTGEAYHQIMPSNKMWKDEFGIFRKKAGFKGIGGSDHRGVYTYSWKINNDTITAIYIKEGDITKHVEITFEFDTLPTWYQQFLELLYAVTKEVVTEYPKEATTVTTSPPTITEKEMLKRNFLNSIGIDYLTNKPFRPVLFSQSFIEGTLRCIDEGILTYISMLNPLPFNGVSRLTTKN